MSALDRNKKIACDNCGTLVSKQNLAKHKKKSSVGTLLYSQCLNFFTKSQNDLKYHVAKKMELLNQKLHTIVTSVKRNFVDVILYVKTKKIHGHTFNTSGDSSPLLNDVDDDNLKGELLACQHFLVDSQLEKGRHRIFNFALDSLSAEKSPQTWIMRFNNSNVQLKLICLLALF